MIKLFLSVTFATAFLGLVGCEPTPAVKGTHDAAETPTPATESTPTVTDPDELQTPTRTTKSTPVKETNEATQTPATTTESTDTVTETNEPAQTPGFTTESGIVSAESNGTVMDFVPGDILVIKTATGEPLRCKFGEVVVYETSDGKIVDASKMRKDSKVRIQFHKDGDDTILDKVIVMEVRD